MQVSDALAVHQKKTGIALLWGTANLFSHPRYACGAATNPSLEVFTFAAAQVKKAMDVTKKLGGMRMFVWLCFLWPVAATVSYFGYAALRRL